MDRRTFTKGLVLSPVVAAAAPVVGLAGSDELYCDDCGMAVFRVREGRVVTRGRLQCGCRSGGGVVVDYFTFEGAVWLEFRREALDGVLRRPESG